MLKTSMKMTKLWIARDKDGQLTGFTRKPIRNYPLHDTRSDFWGFKDYDATDEDTAYPIPRDLYPSLGWADEPLEVTLDTDAIPTQESTMYF